MDKRDTKIAKTLFNYQRTRILQVAKDEGKTVKEIAEILNEKPSRLYYHVNLLEDQGLLKVVREEKVNNFIQKYYQSVNTNILLNEYTFAGSDASDNSDYISSQLYAFTDEAISRIQKDLQMKENNENLSEASIISVQLTKSDWKELNKKIREIISNRGDEGQPGEKWSVNYIIMSYLNDRVE